MELFNALITVVALVSLFLFAVHKFTRQVELLEGDRLKSVLSSLSDSTVRATVLGMIFSTLLQSGTATVVAASSLVNAGLLSWVASVSLVIGANMGSSIATQILTYHSLYVAAYIMIAGSILGYLPTRFKKFGKAIFYFGIIFFSLSLVSNFIAPLETMPLIQGLIAKISNLPIAIFVGLLISICFQSSTVVNGLGLALASAGILALPQCLGLLIGAGIGATSTAVISSYFYDKHARRTVWAHVLYNVIGLLIAYPFLPLILSVAEGTNAQVVTQLGTSYLLFNIFCAIVFLIFLKPFTNLVVKLVK